MNHNAPTRTPERRRAGNGSRHGWRVRRRMVAGVAALAIVLSAAWTFAFAAPANAASVNTATFGSICYHSHCVPQGAIELDLGGTGLNVTNATVILLYSVPSVCLWHTDIDLFDEFGTRYDHFQGPDHEGCPTYGKFQAISRTWDAPYQARVGWACAALYVDHTKLKARTCSYIHR